ncbi:MAG: pH regulation protein F [Leptospiraceae bacterium]|nr:pH regulation protein F [Leptospiraceae bacterium]
MNEFLLYAAVLLTVIIAVPLIRVVRGPTVYDRLVGANAIATKTIVLICLIGFLYGRIDMFIDITLAYAVLGFVGSLIIAKYFTSGKADSDD